MSGRDHQPDSMPRVIQGGMGVAVSSWQLAREVSRGGGLGVVSGTALDAVIARRLQDGDPGGHLRRALSAFPVPALAEAALDRYFIEGGRAADQPYSPSSRPSLRPSLRTQQLAVLGNFAEVWLAKEGHDGLVGVNYLEKIQMSTPFAALGAMLAGVDVVLMGAGIPAHVPALLDALAEGRPHAFPVDVAGDAPEGSAEDDATAVRIDPAEILGGDVPSLRRPGFLAIVASHVLAAYLGRDPVTRPDGFVVEGPTAGGHNAPPRGRLVLDDDGQPVYGPRDAADLGKLADVGLPFWLAGSYGTPERLREALATGASGVQVGTLFALSSDSGFTPEVRQALLSRLADGTLRTRTDAHASPTGFPFKVAQLPGTLADLELRSSREALCDLGHLRTPYRKDDGTVGYRCPAEPAHVYARKGGDAADTEGRVCLCNALTASVGIGQVRRDGYEEPPLVTLGDDLDGPRRMLATYPDGWSAAQALAWLDA